MKSNETALPEAGGKPPVDIQSALPRFGNDLAYYKQILSEFVQQLPERRHQLESALRLQDVETLRRLAHALKGVALSVGADKLVDYSQWIDDLSSKGELSHVAEVLEKIKKESQRIQSFFEGL